MYVLTGKGSVAGRDLANMVVKKCQKKGVLWDDSFPDYTLDFATKIPSVSRSIRDGVEHLVIDEVNNKLKKAEAIHDTYMVLCVTAHRLLPQFNTKMKCINLWDHLYSSLGKEDRRIAYLGTEESMLISDERFLLLPNHADRIGDLITSIKRGYEMLGDAYAGHPKKIFRKIFEDFQTQGVDKFLLACTDLNVCKDWLIELGINENSVICVVDVAADLILSSGAMSAEIKDEISDAKTTMRYKYLDKTDSLFIDRKEGGFLSILSNLPPYSESRLDVLDVGSSSSTYALHLFSHLKKDFGSITCVDISAAALDVVEKNRAEKGSHIEYELVNQSIEFFAEEKKYDVILCLGVLLCLSSDFKFIASVNKVAKILKAGGILITRDPVFDYSDKAYMEFGGVVRNREVYDNAFLNVGFEKIACNEFFVEHATPRSILTSAWVKK